MKVKKLKYPKVKCARCGKCCRVPIVPISHRDLGRLIEHTGRPASGIVRFCSDKEMDYDGESGLWIKFRSGKRAMVLRKKNDRCIYQTSTCACAVYEARPQTCRTFPYSVSFEDDSYEEVSEIILNNILKCNAKKCKDVDIDATIENFRIEYINDDEYYNLIKQWNGSDNDGTVSGFLRHIGF